MGIAGWIDRWAEFCPRKTAIQFEGSAISYGDFAEHVLKLTFVLRTRLEVRSGDRIAFLGFNSPEMLALLFACARLGAMLVPLNWRLAPPEHDYVLRHSGASALFCEGEFAGAVETLKPGLPGCRFVLTDRSSEGWMSLDELMAGSSQDTGEAVTNFETPLLIVYTSGTTGRPKGAVLDQRALAFNAINSVAMHDLTSQDIVLTNLPMFHVGGLNIQTTPALQAGATIILQRRFHPDSTVAALRDHRPTLMILVPALMAALKAHPSWSELDLSCLRAINTGSTTVPESLLDAYLDRGVPVIQVYGLTETAPIVIHQRIEDAWSTRGSTGRAALYCDARIIDGSGAALGPGEKGEIVVRGPNIMSGYWQDPEATADALRDGWFHTGDIGHRDESGLFYVDERLKDVIISGSENIYPAELERILDGCSEIAEAAVVGRPDRKWGEVPVAIVVPVQGAELRDSDILALFEGRLARYKHPREVLFRDALPRNVMGKVLKFELRNQLQKQE